MKILPLVLAPDPILKKISLPILEVNSEIKQFMRDMLNTMYVENGVGLASVQVGFLRRIFVMDVNYEKIHDHNHDHDHDHSSCDGNHIKNANPLFFVNPEIIETSHAKSSFNEGCLSFPGARSEVIRPESIKLKYLDFDGNKQIKTFSGISATCIQHEIDHLNGITFVDRISPLKREMILKKIKKQK